MLLKNLTSLYKRRRLKYVDRFDELKSLMCALNPFILEAYYISSFLSGLKEYIRSILKILKPATPMQDFD
jgi:hypothetical protein